MKLALTFLLALIAFSCSQRLPKKHPWSLLSLTMPYYLPRAMYQLQNPYFLDTFDSINPLESDSEDETVIDDDVNKNWQSDFIQSQSRQANRIRPSLQAQQRFFFGAFNPFLATNAFTPFWRTGSTVVTVTVSSTLTTAVVSNCVPATQLAVGAASVTCARRRRSVIENHFDDSFLDVIPTQVQNVEPTEIPRERRQYQHEISSSKDEDLANGRQNRLMLLTSTSTSTTYIFSSTVIKKTLNVAASAGLSCLPSGYAVC